MSDIDVVLVKLDRLETDIGEIKTDVKELRVTSTNLQINVEKLNVKSGVWGAASGAITSAGLLGMAYVRGWFK